MSTKKRSRRPSPTLASLPPKQAGLLTDLTCYVYQGWEPRIVPASAKRGWMDETPDSFAYRCLPLAVANSHGWEVLSPCGFEARWNGGAGADSVEIRLDPGTDPNRAPVSLFGSGTITFHIEGIFRTSPGWNLWISGPPNGMKDGIAPLAGLIETDWSPYTFTMNWRFTRPGAWVRFEENEPFCFFFPVQRGVLDRLKPDLRPMEDAPELQASFLSWSAARDAFQAWVKQTRPAKPADQWQKLYYRGLDPRGNPGPPDHEAKIRPPAFVQKGSRPVCPVAHKAGSGDRPAVAEQAQDAILKSGLILADIFAGRPSLGSGQTPRMQTGPADDAAED